MDITILISLASWQSMKALMQREPTELEEIQDSAAIDFSPLSLVYYKWPWSYFHDASLPFTLQEEIFFSKSYKMTKGSITLNCNNLYKGILQNSKSVCFLNISLRMGTELSLGSPSYFLFSFHREKLLTMKQNHWADILWICWSKPAPHRLAITV